MTRARLWLVLGAAYGFMAVAMGAVGAHALRGSLPLQLFGYWNTAVRFQFYQALALLALGLFTLIRPTPGQTISGIAFAFGTLFFSGSLYLRCLSGAPAVDLITPIGGAMLLFAWLALLWAGWRCQVKP